MSIFEGEEFETIRHQFPNFNREEKVPHPVGNDDRTINSYAHCIRQGLILLWFFWLFWIFPS